MASNLSTPVFARRTELLRKSALLVKVVLLLFPSRRCFFRVSIFSLALYAAETTRLVINSSKADAEKLQSTPELWYDGNIVMIF